MWVGVDQENSKRTLYGLVHCNSIGIHKQKHPSVFASWELISYYTCSCWLTFYRSIYVPVCCHWLVPTPLSGIHSQSDVLAASCKTMIKHKNISHKLCRWVAISPLPISLWHYMNDTPTTCYIHTSSKISYLWFTDPQKNNILHEFRNTNAITIAGMVLHG